jgi:hypothetical protein
MEIPTHHLEEVSHVCDVDFALAHMVLNNKDYEHFYRDQRAKGRFVLLDNGMYEMGEPLSCTEIYEAADRINASVVCPPDKLGDAKFTYDKFEEMRVHPKRYNKDLMLVLQGSTSDDRLKLFMHSMAHVKMLALPFREPRLQWFTDLLRAVPAHVRWPGRLHLMGVNELDELKAFAGLLNEPSVAWNPALVTVDTAKAVKHAIAGKYLWEVENMRTGAKLDHEAKLDGAQLKRVFANTAYLRTWMV